MIENIKDGTAARVRAFVHALGGDVQTSSFTFNYLPRARRLVFVRAIKVARRYSAACAYGVCLQANTGENVEHIEHRRKICLVF